jgi:hypothetical protein
MKIEKDFSIHGPRWSPLWQISRRIFNGVERGFILTPIAAP